MRERSKRRKEEEQEKAFEAIRRKKKHIVEPKGLSFSSEKSLRGIKSSFGKDFWESFFDSHWTSHLNNCNSFLSILHEENLCTHFHERNNWLPYRRSESIWFSFNSESNRLFCNEFVFFLVFFFYFAINFFLFPLFLSILQWIFLFFFLLFCKWNAFKILEQKNYNRSMVLISCDGTFEQFGLFLMHFLENKKTNIKLLKNNHKNLKKILKKAKINFDKFWKISRIFYNFIVRINNL